MAVLFDETDGLCQRHQAYDGISDGEKDIVAVGLVRRAKGLTGLMTKSSTTPFTSSTSFSEVKVLLPT